MAATIAPRSVPFFNYPWLFKSQEKEIMETLREVMSRGAYIMQRDVEEFENNIREFLNVKFAYGVADGTEAIIMGLLAAGIKPGDEVIVASHTMVATASAVHWVNAKPVLVECGKDHMIDPASIEASITKKTRGILPTQLNGRTADMDAIKKIADKHNLIIVEDAAQALGSKFKGKNAGTFGKAGTFSLFPAKVLGCFGDGGIVVTNDADVAKSLERLRDHGRAVGEREITGWGFNSRLDNIQAAILNLKFKTYPAAIERRRKIATMYQQLLGDLKELQLPPAPGTDERHFDIFQNYELEAERRDELRKHLEEHGVKTLIQWDGKAVHQWKNLGFTEKLPKTDEVFKRCVMIPLNLALEDQDIEYVAQTVRKFYKG